MINVIVPVYKVEKYLTKCVESIQKQTYSNIRIILVDDGSPDRCGEICDKLAKQDSRIVVIHQKNSGLAAARNSGLAAIFSSGLAKSDYVAFIDSDDTIESYMLELLHSMLQNSSCDIAICGHRVLYEGQENRYNRADLKKSENRHHTELLDKESLWHEVYGKLNNAVWNKLYRCDLIGELRFPTGVIHGEDLLFNLNYLTKCKQGAINGSKCYNYLKRSNSITTGGFSEAKLLEIVSKDQALEIVRNNMPSEVPIGEKYCFRARMNVLRSIYKGKVQKEYAEEVEKCRNYVKNKYKGVKRLLSVKEQAEYFLYMYLTEVYKLLVSENRKGDKL